MYINRLWVSGQLKGHSDSSQLLEDCIMDSKSKDKKGLVILSSEKKLSFLADPKYLKYKGFILADTAKPNFELMYLPFEKNAVKPKFKQHVKTPNIIESGFVLYYSNQCPYTAKYVPLIQEFAINNDISFKVIRFETTLQAQNSPAPTTTYSLFYNGNFITNEVLSMKKFEKLCAEILN